MSNNINLLKHLYAAFGLLILSINTPVYAQNVESISGEVLKDVSADELYWVAEVTCEGTEEGRSMQQRAGESSWCAVNFPQLCRATKDSLAEQLCGQQYQSLASPSVTELPALDDAQEQGNQVEVDQTAIIAAPAVRRQPEPAIQATVEPENVVESVTIEPTAQQSSRASSTEVINSNNPSPTINSSNQTLMTAEEIAIEEELIQIEQQMIDLRLKEIELE